MLETKIVEKTKDYSTPKVVYNTFEKQKMDAKRKELDAINDGLRKTILDTIGLP